MRAACPLSRLSAGTSSTPSGRRHTRRRTTTCPTAVRCVTVRRPLLAQPTAGGGKRILPSRHLRLQELLQRLLAKRLARRPHVLFRVLNPVPLRVWEEIEPRCPQPGSSCREPRTKSARIDSFPNSSGPPASPPNSAAGRRRTPCASTRPRPQSAAADPLARSRAHARPPCQTTPSRNRNVFCPLTLPSATKRGHTRYVHPSLIRIDRGTIWTYTNESVFSALAAASPQGGFPEDFRV